MKSLESQESRPEWANTFGSRGREAPVGDLKYAKARRADTFWANHWHFQIPKIEGTPVLRSFPFLLIFVCIWFFFLRSLRFSKAIARKIFHNDPKMADPQCVILADEGLSTQTPTASTSMAWTHFIHFAETRNLFVLFFSRQDAHLLPKRAFPSPAALTEFRATARPINQDLSSK